LFESDTNNDFQSPVLRVADKGPTPEETPAENGLRTAVTQAISHLRENLRTADLLREFQGLTSAEIAGSLGVSVAADKERILPSATASPVALRAYIAGGAKWGSGREME
jgi:DNA-directed RNA polymerase specialized sigma24 family protein